MKQARTSIPTACSWILAWIRSWRRRRHVLTKRRLFFNVPHGFIKCQFYFTREAVWFLLSVISLADCWSCCKVLANTAVDIFRISMFFLGRGGSEFFYIIYRPVKEFRTSHKTITFNMATAIFVETLAIPQDSKRCVLQIHTQNSSRRYSRGT